MLGKETEYELSLEFWLWSAFTDKLNGVPSHVLPNDIEDDMLVKISGKLQIKEGREPSIMVESFSSLIQGETESQEVVKEKNQYLVIKGDNLDDFDDLFDILQGYPGDILVYVIKAGKKYKMNYKILNTISCRKGIFFVVYK